MIEAFPKAARAHIAFSVVPNWMEQDPLSDAPDFVARVAALEGPTVLHGWTHSQGPDFMNWLLYGHENRSEFANLSAAETADRVDRGLAMFAKTGLPKPKWFCAPRWTPSASLNSVLFDRGFEGVLARDGFDLPDRSVSIQPLNFDEGERAWKIGPGRMLRQSLISRLLKRSEPFRLVLHPDDLDHPKTFEQFKQVVARLEADGWQPAPLSAFVGARQ